jgi:hypothetical protein
MYGLDGKLMAFITSPTGTTIGTILIITILLLLHSNYCKSKMDRLIDKILKDKRRLIIVIALFLLPALAQAQKGTSTDSMYADIMGITMQEFQEKVSVRSYGTITTPATFRYTGNITFPSIFVIHSDSGKIEWLTTPDSAGIKFSYWFRETYSQYVDSLKTENQKLKEENKRQAIIIANTPTPEGMAFRDYEILIKRPKRESEDLSKAIKEWTRKFNQWVKVFDKWKRDNGQ